MGFWMAAIPAIASIAGGLMSSRGAKKANEPQPYNETQTSRPWEAADPYIRDLMSRAQGLLNRPDHPMVPGAWGSMLPGGSPLTAASPPAPAGGGGPGAAGGGQDLNWRGRPRAEVQAARAQRREARTQRAQQAQQPQQSMPAPGAGGAPVQPPLNQEGPFAAGRQVQSNMYDILRQGGTPTAQAGNNYVQSALRGQVMNPMLQQLFSRLWNYQPVGARAGAPPQTQPLDPWITSASGH